MISSGTYRAHVGERTFDVAFQDGRLAVNGEAVTYRFGRIAGGYVSLLIEGQSVPATVERLGDGRLRVTMAGRPVEVRVQNEKDLLLERFGFEQAGAGTEREVRAPMPGLVLSVLVEPGHTVEAGDGLLVLEAMKMENELRAKAGGVVQAVHVQPGEAVGKNALLLVLEE